MTSPLDKHKKMHFDLTNVGLRAQATAAGLVQLCAELKRANILPEDAVDRIKNAIADEIIVCAPRSIASQDYRQDIRNRLDLLFAGEKPVGDAEALAFGRDEE